MKLNDTKCRNAKPKPKPYKLADGDGMFLLIRPDGAKYWRQKYYFLGKERLLALGVYPEISLADAREARDGARKLIAKGIDPMAQKKKVKLEAVQNSKNSFEAVAREWHGKQGNRWTPGTSEKIMCYLKNNIFPHLGDRPIADIEPPELLDALRKVEARGTHYTALKVRQLCGQIFRYGVATGTCKRDSSADLKGALTAHKTESYAALNIKDMPEFLQKLENNDARLFAPTRRAIRLLMLTFTRTTEMIHAKWSEFDLDNAQWDIPKERMKMGVGHYVPLSKQAVEILKEQRKDNEHLRSEYVFPNLIRPIKPMSNCTILNALKRMGYKGKMTGHGFRSLAMTTLMEELGYSHEIPDAQLAHSKGDSVRRAYDRTKYLPQRKEMMQRWADFLDAVASKDDVAEADFKRKRA